MTTSSTTPDPIVLGLYCGALGFGYAVCEGIAFPVDWANKEVPKQNDIQFMARVGDLIDRFSPSVIVLQDCSKNGRSRCSERTRRRVRKAMALAKRRRISVYRYSRVDIHQCFAYYDATNRNEIAHTIAKLLPEFAPLVPPKRKIWQAERKPMRIFDALALVLTYYSRELIGPGRGLPTIR